MKNYYSTQSTTELNPDTISIIGAGISGLMTAYNLRLNGYKGDITLYEMAGSSGGRLLSKKVEDGGMVIELGAGRLHKEKHKTLYDLCIKLGLTLMPFNYAARYHGQEEVSAALNQTELLTIFSTLRKAAPSYAGKNTCFADFCTESLSLQTLQLLQRRSGYDTLSNPSLPIEAGISILSHHPEIQYLFYGNTDNWMCIKDGFQSLTTILEQKLKDLITIRYQSELKSIAKSTVEKDGYLLTFETPQGLLSAPTDVVIFAMPLQNIQHIQGWEVLTPANLSQEIVAVPLVKGFVQFNRPWWKDYGLSDVCIIADTPFRKCYLYQSSNTLWFYCDSVSALRARDLMELDAHFPLTLLEEHIGYKMPSDATYLTSGWKFWEHGISFFAEKLMNKDKNFLEVKKNLLVCSDLFTDNLGWVEGSLASSEAIVQHLCGTVKVSKPKAVNPSIQQQMVNTHRT